MAHSRPDNWWENLPHPKKLSLTPVWKSGIVGYEPGVIRCPFCDHIISYSYYRKDYGIAARNTEKEYRKCPEVTLEKWLEFFNAKTEEDVKILTDWFNIPIWF